MQFYKLLSAEPVKYRYAINEINKDIEYMPVEIKKTWAKKVYLMNKTQKTNIIIVNFIKNSN